MATLNLQAKQDFLERDAATPDPIRAIAEPDFTSIDTPEAATLPAIHWKLIKLRRLKADQPDKDTEQRVALEWTLGR